MTTIWTVFNIIICTLRQSLCVVWHVVFLASPWFAWWLCFFWSCSLQRNIEHWMLLSQRNRWSIWVSFLSTGILPKCDTFRAGLDLTCSSFRVLNLDDFLSGPSIDKNSDQCARISWQIKSILSGGLVTRRLESWWQFENKCGWLIITDYMLYIWIFRSILVWSSALRSSKPYNAVYLLLVRGGLNVN